MPSLEELKGRYQSVIDLAKQRGVHLKNLDLQDDKLLIRGDAPSQDVKNEVWNRIKAIDPGYSDLIADIDIDSSLPQPAPMRRRRDRSRRRGRGAAAGVRGRARRQPVQDRARVLR
ncbi:MAG TPA: hypothetical protein VEQ10_03940 [Vicinamibacteria bacterium]|nr:hypothetical protein [Vicinamibacteria bacterium]